MLKKFFTNILLLFLFTTSVSAHTLQLSVIDNGDDTITIIGAFDTGASAAGALVRLESQHSGTVIFRERMPAESELTVKIPDEPYLIVLDGGPGHVSTREGLPPTAGFTTMPERKKTAVSTKNVGWNLPLLVTTGLACILLLLTIFINIRNTNRLLAAMDKKKN